MMHTLLAPAVGPSSVVLVALEPVDGNAKLKTEFFLVGNMRLVNEVHVADRNGLQHRGPERSRGHGQIRLLHGLALSGDFEDGHLRALLVDVTMESPGDEPIPVRVDEVPRHVLPQRDARRTRQAELHGPETPERNLRSAEHRPDFEAVAGQESFGGQHAERIHIVVALGFATGPARGAFEALHEAVTAAEQSFVLGLEVALLLAQPVEPLDLAHGPAQATSEPADDLFEPGHHLADVRAECLRPCHVGVRRRPPLTEGPLDVGDEVVDIPVDQVPERHQV